MIDNFDKHLTKTTVAFLVESATYSSRSNLSFFLFSAKDKNEKKLLGFSFFFLMEADETTIKDGGHVLCLYKCEDSLKFQVRLNLKRQAVPHTEKPQGARGGG